MREESGLLSCYTILDVSDHYNANVYRTELSKESCLALNIEIKPTSGWP